MKLLSGLLGSVLAQTQLLSPFLVDDQPFENIELDLNEGTIRGRRLEDRFLSVKAQKLKHRCSITANRFRSRFFDYL